MKLIKDMAMWTICTLIGMFGAVSLYKVMLGPIPNVAASKGAFVGLYIGMMVMLVYKYFEDKHESEAE